MMKYKHYKNGKIYKLIGFAYSQNEKGEWEEKEVVYEKGDKYFTRNIKEFFEKFEKVSNSSVIPNSSNKGEKMKMKPLKCDICGSLEDVGHILAPLYVQEIFFNRQDHCHLCSKCKRKYYGDLEKKVRKIDQQIMEDVIRINIKEWV